MVAFLFSLFCIVYMAYFCVLSQYTDTCNYVRIMTVKRGRENNIKYMEENTMTKRQKMLGVTEYGYQRGIVDGEFLADIEAFLAKLATVKKGQCLGIEIARQWFEGICPQVKLQQMKPFLHGLTALMPDHIYYSDTHGLDCLTLK